MLTRIVTCYRQWHLVSRWLDCESLFKPGVHWLMVNDAPGDLCPPRLEAEFQRRGVKLITPWFNCGRSRARNLGAEAAQTEWIEFVDGDDLPLPHDLAVLEKSHDAGLVAFPVFEHHGNPPIAIPEDVPSQLPIRNTWAEFLPLLQPLDVRPAGLLWRRAFFRELGGFDARFESAEDFHLVLRAAWAGAHVARSTVPKQIYCVPPGNHNFSPLHVEGHRRLLEWIASNTPSPLPPHFDMWLSKESVYEALIASKRSLPRLPGFLKFLASR